MKPYHKQRLVTRGCFLGGGGVVYMKPFHKQRLVTRGCFLGGGCLHETFAQTKTGDPWLFSWGGCLHETLPQTKTGDPCVVFFGGVVYNKFLKIFVSPQGPANKDCEPVCCFLGGGCLQQILKDICFSPGACKQRLGTRVLFWGGWGKHFAETARK